LLKEKLNPESVMPKKLSHPDRQLFDYLNGALGEPYIRAVEDHLSECADCALMARLINSLKAEFGVLASDVTRADESPDAKAQGSDLKSSVSDEHPNISELASFFYGNRSRARRQVAAHVAVCGSCAAEIAQYARAEREASAHVSSLTATGASPAAWEMIREWEESSFAVPKPAIEAIGQELLDKLSELFVERNEQLREMAQDVSGKMSAAEGELVPVAIVDREGELRGVEMFERTTGPRGASILKHTAESTRFDNKPVHALLDFGEGTSVVVSDRIRKNTARLKLARPRAKLRRADYFIVED
jgi:hypothetical protein